MPDHPTSGQISHNAPKGGNPNIHPDPNATFVPSPLPTGPGPSIRDSVMAAWRKVMEPSELRQMPRPGIDTTTPQGREILHSLLGPDGSYGGLITPQAPTGSTAAGVGPGQAFLVGTGRAFTEGGNTLGRLGTGSRMLAAALRGDSLGQQQLAAQLDAERRQNADRADLYRPLNNSRVGARLGETVGLSILPLPY